MAIITPAGHALGLNKQPVDTRDFLYAPKIAPQALPTTVDLRTSKYRPPIWNQGRLGSCTSFSTARIAEMTYGINGHHNQFEPSHLFLYFNARDIEGNTANDAGATMRDALQALVKYGAPAEHWWPYNDSNPGPFSQKPPADAYTNASKHKATQYQSISLDLQTMKAFLASGYPFMMGIAVYESFESIQADRTGIIPMPAPGEQELGGHASSVLGYDDSHQWFICDNSWGPGWGDKGSYYLPYSFATNGTLAYDAWGIVQES